MKAVPSPLSILPGAQQTQQRAPGRKGSDREADFAESLALVIAGQQMGPAAEQPPGAGEGVDVHARLVATPAGRHAASRPGEAPKPGGRTAFEGAAADPRRSSVPGVAGRDAAPGPGALAGEAKAAAQAKARSADGIAQTPSGLQSPRADANRDVAPSPFAVGKAANPAHAESRRDPPTTSVQARIDRTAHVPVKHAANVGSTPGRSSAPAAGAVTPAPGGVATPQSSFGSPGPTVRATPGSAAYATPLPPAKVAAAERSGALPVRDPSTPLAARSAPAERSGALPVRDPSTPHAGRVAPQTGSHRTDVAAPVHPLGHAPAVATSDDLARAPRAHEPSRSVQHPVLGKESGDERMDAPPLRPLPRGIGTAGAPAPAVMPAAAVDAPAIARTRVEPIDVAGGDDVVMAVGAQGSSEIASSIRRTADPTHLDPRVDPTPFSFSTQGEPQASAPAPTVAPAARPAPIPQDDTLLGGLDAGLVLDAAGAKLSVRDTGSGDLALDVRIQDGSLDIRAGGSAAPVMAANEAELRLALAGAGMRLGQLAVEASVEGRIPAGSLAANTERRRGRGDEREAKKVEGKETRDAGEEPASIHVKV